MTERTFSSSPGLCAGGRLSALVVLVRHAAPVLVALLALRSRELGSGVLRLGLLLVVLGALGHDHSVLLDGLRQRYRHCFETGCQLLKQILL